MGGILKINGETMTENTRLDLVDSLAIKADEVSFTQTGLGSQTTDIDSKARERVTPEDFGAIGDGGLHPLSERYSTLAKAQLDYPFATSLTQQIDYCAIVAAITSQLYTSHGAFYFSGPEVHLRDGAVYRMGSDTLQIKRTTHIKGAGSGKPWSSMAAMRWEPGASGIIFHRVNTIGGGIEPFSTGGDGSTIEGVRILGGIGPVDALGGHAIWFRASAVVRNCYIGNFRGNGYHVVATATGETIPAVEGNANLFRIEGGRVEGCENGIYVQGADANAGSVINCDFSGNRRWGIWDESFLGNNYHNCHTDNNGDGITVDGVSAFASFGGNSYQAVPTATAGQLVATTPGTNNAIWWPVASVGLRSIAWTGSNPSGTYRPGGPVYTVGGNNRVGLFGHYNESGQGTMFLGPLTMAVNGIFDLPVGGVALLAANNNLRTPSGIFSEAVSSTGKTVSARLGGDAGNGDILQWEHSDDNPSFISRFHRDGADWVVDNANSGARRYFTLTGELTARQFGTGANVPYVFATQRIGLGEGADARFITYGSAAPTTGAHAQGEIVFNNAPTAGGTVGWVCTTGGSPGTWKTFGTIAA